MFGCYLQESYESLLLYEALCHRYGVTPAIKIVSQTSYSMYVFVYDNLYPICSPR